MFTITLVCIGLTGLRAQTVTDADSNAYMTITIGKQVWMAENLKTTRLNDGKMIPLVTDEKAWKGLQTPGYCWYNNDTGNKDIYGALYNWYAVNTGKLCPKGWHVPSQTDWTDLVIFLGNENLAGVKLKEAGTTHWKNVLIISTNDYDFSALPGGTRLYSGYFPTFGGSYAVWWSSTPFSEFHAWNRGLHDSSSRFWKGHDDVHSGFSVRCLKD